MVDALAWTLRFLRPFRVRVAAVLVLTVGEIALAALAPWPLKVLVDNVLGGAALPSALASVLPDLLTATPIALLGLVVAGGFVVQLLAEVVRATHTQLQVDMAQRVVYRLRADLLDHLQALPLGHHLRMKTADGVYRLDADAHCVDDLVIGGVFPLALAGLNLLVMFSVLLWVDLWLALLSLVVAPFLYLALRYHASTLTHQAETVKELEAGVIQRSFEVLRTIAVVKSFARERHELQRFRQTGDATRRARLALTWQESLFSMTVTAITLAGTALVLGVGGLHVLEGSLSIGSLLVVTAYLSAVYDPISEIARTTGALQQAVVSAGRVREVLATPPEPLDPPANAAADPSTIRGHVRFEAVSFAYEPGHPVLTEVTFDARPGELVAIVGLTGAGKTTIAHLIPRLFEPTSGEVRIDGEPARRYPLRALRERVALVPQQPVLFDSTVAENIRYGQLDATDEDVVRAAQSARIHDRILRLPHGYDTALAEDGATLSGGERQRMAIARALLKRAPILVLDEPTSALDTISEQAVFEALAHGRDGRTTLVIAHRLTTVQNATRILVVHEGHIEAQGPHAELLDASPLYRRMCARLSVGASLDEPETIDEVLSAGSPS